MVAPPTPMLLQLGRTAIPALLLLLAARMNGEGGEVDPGLQGAVDVLRGLHARLFEQSGSTPPDPRTLGAILDAVESIRRTVA